MTTPLLRVAIYARRALADADLQGQIDACQAFATEQGWRVIGIYADHGCSGRRIDHPAIARLRRDAAAGRVDIILCEERDRLSRDMGKLTRLVAELDGAGTSIRTITEGRLNDMLPRMKGFLQLQAKLRSADNRRRASARI